VRSEIFTGLVPIMSAAKEGGASAAYLSGGGSTVAAFVRGDVSERVARLMTQAAISKGFSGRSMSDLFEAMEKGENVIPLDARQSFGFEAEHIPNAINIPHREMNEVTTKHLDKDVLYVTYCDGICCNASTKV
jgi:hypothetical protein